MTVTVNDIWEDVRKILGGCDTKHGFRKITDAIEVLSNSGDFDPLLGYVDICVDGRVVTLPREVDTILAANIGGKPAMGRDSLFRFHLNGLGDCNIPCDYSWDDQGLVPTYRDLATPSKLVATVTDEDDEGKQLWAYGFNDSGTWVRSKENEVWVDGYRVPTIFGYSLPDVNAPIFSRVTRIRKEEFNLPVRLSSFDISATTGTILGVFDWDETEPQYRRIKLNRDTCWIRIAYRKRIFKVRSMEDVLPIPSQSAILMMIWAMKFYDEGELSRATAYEATARRWVTEAAWAHGTNLSLPIQVNDRNDIMDKCDYVD